ncbi:MAG TPA: ABC transporter permease [Phycisphaerales bacterium]|nr:ABC transporter permease [Phycisphaerales bacterium]
MQFFLETVRLGLHNLRLHKLRSVLTSLGIILGVAAVIVMVSIGEGNKQAALRDIQALGATNIIARSFKPPETTSMGANQTQFLARYGLRREDLRRLKAHMPFVADIVPLKAVGDEMLYGDKRMVSQAFGTTPDLLRVARLRLQRGRYLSPQDMDAKLAVAVIGSEVADKFFALEDPLDKVFRIKDQAFTVVGVLNPVGLAGGAGTALVGRDLNKDVHIPLTTAEQLFGDLIMRRVAGSNSQEEIELSEIYITSQATEDVIRDAALVRQIVRAGHPDLNDVQMVVPWELLEAQKRTQMIWNIVLISIAAISLLIGGIGIMNIMLASVTERTREIGIRRALGATRKHIIWQFLVETGSLSAVGGLLGIATGVGLSLAVGKLLPWVLTLKMVRGFVQAKVNLETQITWWSIIVSFIVAAAVGLIFGIYPAIIASRQDPIVALRHD